MNIGTTGTLPAQPARWLPGPNNGGGAALVDPTDVGFVVGYSLGDVNHLLTGDGIAPAQAANEVGADYQVILVDPSTTPIFGLADRATNSSSGGKGVVSFAYDNSVFGGTSGAVVFGDPRSATRKGALYLGTGVPANAGGSNGDFALRTDTPGTVNQRLYVKSAGAWVGIL